jgi:hypothetical protein
MSYEPIPYQAPAQVVEALKQERANCVAYGNTTRVAKIDRQLAELGVKQEAAEKRAAAAEETPDARSSVPQGRRARPGTEATTAAESKTEA